MEVGPDIVYIVGKGKSEELRYSLRSLKNLPHYRVWIFGYCPSWVDTEVVHFVPVEQKGKSKWEKAGGTLKVISQQSRLGDFYLFNDDFFVVNPIEKVEYFKWGKLKDRVLHYGKKGSSGLSLRIEQAMKALEKRGKTTFNYELHVPLKMNREKLAEVLDIYEGIGATRSLYCNELGIIGKESQDVKVFGNSDKLRGDFVSTTDMSFRNGQIGRDIRKRFSERSIYEN